MSAEQSFGRLLRTSRLASFDPRIPQVYTTYGKARNNGDWGLKRNLPVTVRTNAITVQALDTNEHQTPFDSALKQVGLLRRWQELFPDSRPPAPRAVSQPLNIQRLSESEWQALKSRAHKLRHQWRAEVRTLKRQPDEFLRFLNVVQRPSGTLRNEAYTMTEPGVHRHTAAVPMSKPGSGALPIVAPRYDWWQSPQQPVPGRIVSRNAAGFMVGVGGFVGVLPLYRSLVIGTVNPTVQHFYVERILLDERGRINLQLSSSDEEQSRANRALTYRANRRALGQPIAKSDFRTRGPQQGAGERRRAAPKKFDDTLLDTLLDIYQDTGDAPTASVGSRSTAQRFTTPRSQALPTSPSVEIDDSIFTSLSEPMSKDQRETSNAPHRRDYRQNRISPNRQAANDRGDSIIAELFESFNIKDKDE